MKILTSLSPSLCAHRRDSVTVIRRKKFSATSATTAGTGVSSGRPSSGLVERRGLLQADWAQERIRMALHEPPRRRVAAMDLRHAKRPVLLVASRRR